MGPGENRASETSEEIWRTRTRPSLGGGKYEIFAKLGRGGMADVYLATMRGALGFKKLAVIKQLQAQFAADGDIVGMFLDEARLAARLAHPNVVHTYEVGREEDTYFIAMEFLDGQPLNRLEREAARSGRPLDREVCVRIVSDALGGLHYAHELRDYDGSPFHLVHRDVSPHNIFVNYDGQVKLVDFGIAKAALSGATTGTGVLKGKLAYMAPEQAMSEEVDRRTDVFAMGVVLWGLLTGKRLFESDAGGGTLRKVLEANVPPLSSVASVGADPALDAILAKALARDPERRFATAQEMREALQGWSSRRRLVQGEEVGRYVREMFRDARAQLGELIKEQMGREAGEPAPAWSDEVPSAGAVPVPERDITALDAAGSVRPPEARSVLPHGSRSRRRLWLAAALGAGVAAVASSMVARAVAGDGATLVAAATPGPSPRTAPGPQASPAAAIALPVSPAPSPVLAAPPPPAQVETVVRSAPPPRPRGISRATPSVPRPATPPEPVSPRAVTASPPADILAAPPKPSARAIDTSNPWQQ